MMLDLYEYWDLSNDINSKEMISRRYVDRVFECIVNNENINSKKNNKQKIDDIKLYLNNLYFNDSIKYAKPKTLYLKIIYFLMKNKSYVLLQFLAKFVFFIKNNFISIFSVLKIKR